MTNVALQLIRWQERIKDMLSVMGLCGWLYALAPEWQLIRKVATELG
jgi:hypothetical protein